MDYRSLGNTRLRVSALGYGSGAIGGLFVRGDPEEQRRAAVRALDAGITYFDTAPSYGDGRSETNLGRVFRDLAAWGRVVVGTKVRLQPADLRHPKDAIVRSAKESLKRLGRDSIDLLQLHNPVRPDGAATGGNALDLGTVLGEVADGLHEASRQGLAAHVGLTGLGEAAPLRAVVDSGRFATIQTYFNALNPSAGFAGVSGSGQDFCGLIDAAAAAAMGVIAIRVMAAGAVSGTPERHANAGDPGDPLAAGAEYTRDLGRARGLVALAREVGVEGPMELALRFALTKPAVSSVLVGYSDLAQLEDAIRWTERGPLSPDAVNRTLAVAR
jgi:aryl-alcohol dehydrogenase-like predicted oxidoreductase